MDYKHFSWSDLEKAIDVVENQIKESKIKFDWIVSVNRGGLIPGVILSHRMKANHGVITIKNYDNKQKKKNIIKDLYISLDPTVDFSGKLLIVDEIATSGETLQEAKKFIKKDHDIKQINIATIYYQNRSIIKPDFYYEEIDPKTWVIFPWENEE